MNYNNQLPIGGEANVPAVVTLEDSRFERYLAELHDIEATEDEKRELLGIIYSIMRSFVELGFDVGSSVVWDSIAQSAFNDASSGTEDGDNDKEDRHVIE